MNNIKKISIIGLVLFVSFPMLLIPFVQAEGASTSFDPEYWTFGMGVGSVITYEWSTLLEPCCPGAPYLVDGVYVDPVTFGMLPGDLMIVKITEIKKDYIKYTRQFIGQEGSYNFTSDPLTIPRTGINLVDAHMAHPFMTTNRTLLQERFSQNIDKDNFTIDDKNSWFGWSSINTYDVDTGFLIRFNLTRRSPLWTAVSEIKNKTLAPYALISSTPSASFVLISGEFLFIVGILILKRKRARH